MYGSYGYAEYGAATPTATELAAAQARLQKTGQMLADRMRQLSVAEAQAAGKMRGGPSAGDIRHLQDSVILLATQNAQAQMDYDQMRKVALSAKVKKMATMEKNAAAKTAAIEAAAAEMALQAAQKEAAAIQARVAAEAAALRAAAAAAATEQQRQLYLRQQKEAAATAHQKHLYLRQQKEEAAAAEALRQPTFTTEIPQYSVDLEEWDVPGKVTTMRSQKKPNYLLWGLGALVVYRLVK